MIKPLNQFPLMARYKKVFPITEHTIIAYDEIIYCNSDLPNHLIVHENTHFKQQKEVGLNKWVDMYLTNDNFRLNQEIEAYKNQLASISDRNRRTKIRLICARDLSSPLYGSIININEAVKILK